MFNIDTFNKNFEEYDRWFSENEEFYKSELNVLKELIPSGENAIEIGVGTGRFASKLGIEIGVEPSKGMAKIGKERGINIYEAVAENLPFKDNSFDTVLMMMTICFVKNAKKSLNEAYRVLKKDGSLIVGFIDRESAIGKIYQAEKSNSEFYKEAIIYTTDEIVELLKNSSFDNFQIKQSLFTINDKIETKEIKDGYDSGSFIAVKSQKID